MLATWCVGGEAYNMSILKQRTCYLYKMHHPVSSDWMELNGKGGGSDVSLTPGSWSREVNVLLPQIFSAMTD